jgi:hypothetical protein
MPPDLDSQTRLAAPATPRRVPVWPCRTLPVASSLGPAGSSSPLLAWPRRPRGLDWPHDLICITSLLNAICLPGMLLLLEEMPRVNSASCKAKMYLPASVGLSLVTAELQYRPKAYMALTVE